MRWVRSDWIVVFLVSGLVQLSTACRSPAKTPPPAVVGDGQVTGGGNGQPAADVQGRDAGVTWREVPPPSPAPAADGGACPRKLERCCDGHCGTPLECAQLACDPAPQHPPAQER